MYLVVIESALSAIAGTRLRWQKLTRTGDVAVSPARSLHAGDRESPLDRRGPIDSRPCPGPGDEAMALEAARRRALEV